MVNFVGAGTGAVDLITVRGMKLLSKADVIIYAGSLVNKELLGYAKEDCLIYDSSKLDFDEVMEIMLKAEKEGCCSEKIIRTDTNSFIHNNIFQKSAIYFFIRFGFFMVLAIAISGIFDSSYIIGALIFLLIFLI